MNLPQRKLQRLKNFDYSQNAAYFITLCTHNRMHLFGKIENGIMILNNAGEMVSDKIKEIPTVYEDVLIDKFVIMPNHLHAIILIQNFGMIQVSVPQRSGTTQGSFPTLSEYVQRFKSITTKLYIDGVKNGEYPAFDKKIWQKSYYDHVIRKEDDYQNIWEYIDTNPLKWELDKYYNQENL